MKHNWGFAMHARFLVMTVFVLAIAMVFISVSTWAQNGTEPQKSEQQMPEGRFIDLFRMEYKSDSTSTGVEKLFEAAREYIERCCHSRKDVISLLKDNGFNVSIYNDIKTEKLKLSSRGIGGVVYDELISGTRSPGLLRFWQITTTYRANVYFRDGKIVHVSAVVDTAMP